MSDLYGLYKEARERGKIFTDIRADNIGILLKENKLHWNESLADEGQGLLNKDSFKKDLQPGDYVFF